MKILQIEIKESLEKARKESTENSKTEAEIKETKSDQQKNFDGVQENLGKLFGKFGCITGQLNNIVSMSVYMSNDTSVVVKLIFKDKSFLFTGDISQRIEKQLTDVDVDILKVAHHGSKSSSSTDFVQAVNPEIAVISVGDNNYGHPAKEVLQLFEQFGIQVLITKELGDIKFAF